VKALRDAVKEKRVDEKVLIEIMASATPEQAHQLSTAYKANYGISLQEVFHSALSGAFGKIMVALATPLADFDAICLHDALSGIGTNEEMLMEILIGRSNAEILAIARSYKNLFSKDLESAISHELSHHLKRFFVVLLQAQRDETTQLLNVEEDVESLFQAGKNKHHKDACVFISTLCNRSDLHLMAVFEEYQMKHGCTVEELVRRDFKGDLERSLMALVHSIQNRPAHVATLFESALHSSSPLKKYDEAKLIRLAVRHRDPRVMALVREAYQNVYGKSLYRRVEDVLDKQGELKRVVLGCVGLDVVAA
jgi:annexin A7/11